MLGQLGYNPSVASSVKSRSVLKLELAVLEMNASLPESDLEIILADIPEEERNIITTDYQY